MVYVCIFLFLWFSIWCDVIFFVIFVNEFGLMIFWLSFFSFLDRVLRCLSSLLRGIGLLGCYVSDLLKCSVMSLVLDFFFFIFFVVFWWGVMMCDKFWLFGWVDGFCVLMDWSVVDGWLMFWSGDGKIEYVCVIVNYWVLFVIGDWRWFVVCFGWDGWGIVVVLFLEFKWE